MSRDQSSGEVTADDVAALAGVSRWTVNRAFKKDASISDKARTKVMAAAEELGYVPNLLASSLATDKSRLVALLVDDFANPHKLVMLERLSRILRKHGWDSMLVNTLNEDDTKAALLDASQRRVDAAVLIGVKFNDDVLATALGARRVRQLLVFSRFSEDPNTISVCCVDRTAMKLITDHVIDRGYDRPVFLAGPQTRSAHLLRKETFLSSWRAVKGTEPDFITVDAYDQQLAYDGVVTYLNRFSRDAYPDIFVCENDALAMGAVDAIRHEFGLRIPEDIAVTGFDDVPLAANPNYRLTTYRQPITAMAEGLVALLKGEAEPASLAEFTGELIIRESC